MGDPHGANRRLTGYGPIRLLCAVLGVFRTIVASLLPLLAPVMIVFFVACFCIGLNGASVAPVGPCVASLEGCVLSRSIAFRNLSGLLRVLLALAVTILFVLSNRRWRAPLRRVRFHLLFMEDEISPLLYGGRANPTRKC